MADRQRSKRPAAAALAAARARLAACTGGARGPPSSRPPTPSARPRACTRSRPRRAPERAPPAREARPEPALAARAAALRRRLPRAHRALEAEAARLSKGKAEPSNVRVAACVRALGAREDLVSLRADGRAAAGLEHEARHHRRGADPARARGAVGDALRGRRAARDGRCSRRSRRARGRRSAVGRGRTRRGRGRASRTLARALARAGPAAIQRRPRARRGHVSSAGPGPSWPDPSQRWAEYCALSGGFSANGGILHALVRAGRRARAASVAVHPSPHG
jgi:hypothetical protein